LSLSTPLKNRWGIREKSGPKLLRIYFPFPLRFVARFSDFGA